MLKWVQRHINTPWAQGLLLQVIDNNAAYTSFTFLCGFLIVFRTSQAYGRFWEGCTSIKSMEAEWLSGCSAAVSFCRLSTAEEVLILRFQHQLIRLMSMLHAAALAQLEGTEEGELPRAFMLELIDARGIDKESLETLRNEECKVELIIQWLQALMVDNIKNGVLNIPPPILSRVFHNLSNGLHHFYDAYKIAYSVPFSLHAGYRSPADTPLVGHANRDSHVDKVYILVRSILLPHNVHPVGSEHDCNATRESIWDRFE